MLDSKGLKPKSTLQPRLGFGDSSKDPTKKDKGKAKAKIPHTRETFPSSSDVINDFTVSMAENDDYQLANVLISSRIEVINNWEVEDILDIIFIE